MPDRERYGHQLQERCPSLDYQRVGVGGLCAPTGEGDADASQESKLAGSDCEPIYVQEEIPNYGDAT
jgi:hypothetical protein